MEEVAGVLVNNKPFISNKVKTVTGRSLLVTSVLALAVTALFVSIYFNKGLASKLNLNNLNGSLLGRLIPIAPLVGAAVFAVGGICFLCSRKPKQQNSDAREYPNSSPFKTRLTGSSEDSLQASPTASPGNLPASSSSNAATPPSSLANSPSNSPERRSPAPPPSPEARTPPRKESPVRSPSPSHDSAPTALPTLPVVFVAPTVESIAETQLNVQDLAFERVIQKAIKAHHKLIRIGVPKSTSEAEGITLDPRTLIMAKELLRPYIDPFSAILSEEQKRIALQTVLTGQRDSPKIIRFPEIISFPKSSINNSLPGLPSFENKLDRAVENFAKLLVEPTVVISFDIPKLLVEIDKDPSLIAYYHNDMLYKDFVSASNKFEGANLLEKLLDRVKNKNPPAAELIEKFVSSHLVEMHKDFIAYKLFMVIYFAGSVNRKVYEDSISSMLSERGILGNQSNFQLHTPRMRICFNDCMETGGNFECEHELRNVLTGTSTVYFNSNCIFSPLNPDSGYISPILNLRMTGLEKEELILNIGSYFNSQLNKQIREEILGISQKLTGMIEGLIEFPDNRESRLKDAHMAMQILMVYYDMYVVVGTDCFKRTEKKIVDCLEILNKNLSILRNLRVHGSEKFEANLSIFIDLAYTKFKSLVEKCLEPTVKRVANVQEVRAIKAEKYSICLNTMHHALQESLADPKLSSLQCPTIEKLLEYAKETVKDFDPDRYWKDVMFEEQKRMGLSYLKLHSPPAPLTAETAKVELFRCVYTLCTALSDSKQPNYENDTYLDGLRDRYNVQFIQALSTGLDLFEAKVLPPQFDSIKELFMDLADKLYTNIDLDQHLFNLMNLFSDEAAQSSPKTVPVGEPPIITSLKTTFNTFNDLKDEQTASVWARMGKSSAENWLAFYANRGGNPTHVLSKIDVEINKIKRPIVIKAYGSPTIEDGVNPARICPEFRAHLLRMAERGESHLHVVFQNLIPPHMKDMLKGETNETGRGNVTLDLQDDPLLKDAYFSMGLSKNSGFYNQSGRKNEEYGDYKKELMDQFFVLKRHESGCYIPQKIIDKYIGKGQNLEEIFKDIADKIHHNMFKDKVELTPDEKKKFTEIFYTFIVLRIAVDLKVTSLAEICKDMIDRGMMALVRLMGMCGIACSKDGANNDDFAKRMRAYTMVRAYMARKRVPIPARFDRMIEDYTFALKNQADVKNLFKAIFGDKVAFAV